MINILDFKQAEDNLFIYINKTFLDEKYITPSDYINMNRKVIYIVNNHSKEFLIEILYNILFYILKKVIY